MKQTRKGRNWHFGMKLHIGADKRGIVHTVRATAASVADITQLPELLHGQEREVFGDQAYWKEDDREFLEAWGMRYRINRRATSKRPLGARWRMIYRGVADPGARRTRLSVVKQLWGFAKRDTAAWPRTWHGRRLCLRWLISTSFGVNCSRRGSDEVVIPIQHHRKPARPFRSDQAPIAPSPFCLIFLTSLSNSSCITTCAELP